MSSLAGQASIIALRGDFFDALVALDLLERDGRGRYGTTRETARYLDRNSDRYVGGELEFASARQFGPWGLFTAGAAHRPAAERRAGRPKLSRLLCRQRRSPECRQGHERRHPAGGRRHGRTLPMAGLSNLLRYRHGTRLPPGGGSRLPIRMSRAGASTCRALKGLFEDHVGRHGLGDRLRFQAGDFFKDRLPSAEVLVMGRVLHNSDLATKKVLLQKAYDALPPGGALIVYERLIDDERRTSGLRTPPPA